MAENPRTDPLNRPAYPVGPRGTGAATGNKAEDELAEQGIHPLSRRQSEGSQPEREQGA